VVVIAAGYPAVGPVVTIGSLRLGP
jgi:hypothetical protein